MRNGFEMWRGNIIEYVCRAGSKKYDGMDAVQSETTDLCKADGFAFAAGHRVNPSPLTAMAPIWRRGEYRYIGPIHRRTGTSGRSPICRSHR